MVAPCLSTKEASFLNEDILWLQRGLQKWSPKKLEFPQESHAGRKKRLKLCQPRGLEDCCVLSIHRTKHIRWKRSVKATAESEC
ncbi:rCG29744 [Rattus norvegicus]|uniref:RCG29744 n=1 Tax=Rattus norvegicus TaxID=10116 RepID=A6ILT3_RAT|nr:rCG29744 [Rattus norvegicus]